MAYTPVAVENFSALDLLGDPGAVGWSAAIDILNVDVDKRGRLRSRDGYAKFTSAAGAFAYESVAPFYTVAGTKQLIAGRGGSIDALDTSGALVAAQASADNATANISVARHAAPGSEHAYVSSFDAGAGVVYRWNGTAWSTPAWTTTTPTGRLLAVQTPDNRLVNARYNSTTAGNNPSTVRFSDAGTPTTWGANNYVDISPGDGEDITALIAWNDLLFAFKETKFAVFYGNSTDSTGNPIFNNRVVVGEGVAVTETYSAYRAVTATPLGVFFLNRHGIWLTTGSQAKLVSGPVEPIFRNSASSFFASSALNQAKIKLCAMTWFENRLIISYPSGSATANDRVIVYDPGREMWTLWDIPAAGMCSFRVSDKEDLMFGYASGTKDVGRFSSVPGTYTQDGGNGTSTGAAITSRYRSGFSDLGYPNMKTVREWILDGIGSPTFKTSHDFGSLETGAAVTLGTSPATAEGRRRFAVRGRQLSWQVGATTAWTLNNITANIREQRPPGVNSAT